MGRTEEEKTSCHLVRIVVTRFFAAMFFTRQALPWLLVLASAASVAAQDLGPFGGTPENARRYTECMARARKEPLRALPIAEKWMTDGGGLGARHCVAIAMFEAGRRAIRVDRPRPRPGAPRPARRSMGAGRPGVERCGRGRQGCGGADPRDRPQAQRSRSLDRPRPHLCRLERMAARGLRFRPRPG